MKDLREIAEVEGLDYFETTSERNGYPSNIKGALKGFENFKQAEEIAEKYNLAIETFTKKDGWQFWYRTDNTAYEAFKNSSEDYGDNYSHFYFNQFESEEEFFEEEIKPALENFNSFTDLQTFLDSKKKVWEEIEALEENQIVITYEGDYSETITVESMSFYHDTKHQVIGLI